jgi:CheY-like chemotaxis protein
MYFRRQWDIVLVDDEPDVIMVTRVALRGLKVHGLPLAIEGLASKADAIARFRDPSLAQPAVALIDMGLETEEAGLELCSEIRALGNRTTTLVVRTGHAGIDPQKQIVQNYDVTTYLTKPEATRDKLFATVAGGVREYAAARMHESYVEWTARILASGSSREAVLSTLRAIVGALGDGDLAFLVGVGEDVAGTGQYADAGRARARHAELDALPKEALASGGRMARQGGAFVLEPEPDPAQARIALVGETSLFPVPSSIHRGFCDLMRFVRALAH